ncbi:MAG: PASTA domain-containing protein [Clostridia bacterium]|nr:PASTA domain-containing protein [Clostridia bacterium]
MAERRRRKKPEAGVGEITAHERMRPTSKAGARGVVLFLIVAAAALIGCVGRIANLSLIHGEEYRQKAERQQLSVTTLDASRGTIYDANMNVLAQSASVWMCFVNPSKITDKNRADVLDVLCDCLDLDRETLITELDENSKLGYYKIKGKIEYAEKTALLDRVREIRKEKHNDIDSVIFVDPDTKRYYPGGTLASNVLGFTGVDGDGLYGIESYYEKILRGTSGRIVTARDGVQFEMENAYEVTYEAQQGTDLVLTLNSELQTILRSALEDAYHETQAKKVYGIIQDTKTGAILAVSGLPDFDPNDPYTVQYPELETYFATYGTAEEKADPHVAAQYEQWKAKAIADFYFPGSVYKVFLVAGALEEGVIDENTGYHCTGTITVGPRTIKDYYTTGHGDETPCTLLVNSCNCFSVNVGLQMGTELYYKYFQGFGFTDRTGIDMSGEGTPAVNVTYHDPAVSFTTSDLASASFGQSIAVTPLQVVTAVSALGNGGKLMQPYIVSKQIDGDGNVLSYTEPVVKRQVVSEKTADTVRGWMTQVVSDGTGKNARPAGYSVAGKTGTSEKLGSGDGVYIASFAGFAPADDPRISVVIVIDEPRGDEYSGGAIAAPVAREVFEKALNYLGVEPSYSEKELQEMSVPMEDLIGGTVSTVRERLEGAGYTVRVVGDGAAVSAQVPEAGRQIPKNGVVVLYSQGYTETEQVAVPDFTGMTVSQASKEAAAAGVNLKISGNSSGDGSFVVYKQDVDAGEMIDAGTTVAVAFRTVDGVHD